MLSYLFTLEYLKSIIYTVPAILLAISAHEFAHGYVSYKLGDPTPKMDGRLTLNPFAHLDLWGTVCLILFRMGWAKPVRINTAYYKDKKKGTILVSLAGPAMNYIMAFVSMLIYGLFYKAGSSFGIWFYYLAVINVGLGTFNLIPIPPLDGSNVLQELFPGIGDFYRRIRRYAMPILFLCLFTGVLIIPLNRVNSAVMNGMWDIVKKILKIQILPQGSGSYI
ncbi:site-2 protease family protein [Dorea acetigenes]|jgi:Zn-dependent protease|uniref:Site-2 protease family protein n=1 Tax=Dorea acetigenes TaxID=2981787 RepID=A0ABT2RPB1_9FIRM|nr:site-2 protease family protein [Dorea acetigenes]MCB6415079.1 site-2 protease family protein [Faecalimonas umbilicata]MCU6687181.1 site-2 protease family protein [Dorea acetigenes]SCJ30485.1 Zn-dependent proteases [uncultured Clostridium sp.]